MTTTTMATPCSLSKISWKDSFGFLVDFWAKILIWVFSENSSGFSKNGMVLPKYAHLPAQRSRCCAFGCTKGGPGLRSAPEDPEIPLRYQPDRMCRTHVEANAKVQSVLCLRLLGPAFDPVLNHFIWLNMSKYINCQWTYLNKYRKYYFHLRFNCIFCFDSVWPP